MAHPSGPPSATAALGHATSRLLFSRASRAVAISAEAARAPGTGPVPRRGSPGPGRAAPPPARPRSPRRRSPRRRRPRAARPRSAAPPRARELAALREKRAPGSRRSLVAGAGRGPDRGEDADQHPASSGLAARRSSSASQPAATRAASRRRSRSPPSLPATARSTARRPRPGRRLCRRTGSTTCSSRPARSQGGLDVSPRVTLLHQLLEHRLQQARRSNCATYSFRSTSISPTFVHSLPGQLRVPERLLLVEIGHQMSVDDVRQELGQPLGAARRSVRCGSASRRRRSRRGWRLPARRSAVA